MLSRNAFVAAFAACALALAACASSNADADPNVAPVGSIARGKSLVEANCTSCHAVGPTGASPVAEAPPFRTLSQRYPLSDLEEALAEGILVGHPMMPEFKLQPAQIDDLIAYLTSIQEKR